MLSKILNVVLIVLVLGFIANYVYRLPKFDDGETAPQFSATLADGSSFDLSDLKGRYVLLDFWGSWCAPCRRDNPNIVALHEKYSDKQFTDASGFDVVSISIETNEKSWKRAIEKDGLAWKYHIVQLDRFKSPIAVQYGVREIPTKYLLGPAGNILSVNQSAEEMAAFLQGKLK